MAAGWKTFWTLKKAFYFFPVIKPPLPFTPFCLYSLHCYCNLPSTFFSRRLHRSAAPSPSRSLCLCQDLLRYHQTPRCCHPAQADMCRPPAQEPWAAGAEPSAPQAGAASEAAAGAPAAPGAAKQTAGRGGAGEEEAGGGGGEEEEGGS